VDNPQVQRVEKGLRLWVKFTAPGSMKRLQLQNRTSVPRAIASATGTEAEIHKHLLTVLMPEMEKKLNGGEPKKRTLCLDTPVPESKRMTRDPKSWQNSLQATQKVRATGGSGIREGGSKTAPKTAAIGGNKAIEQLKQQLHFEEGADVDNAEELLAAAVADNAELRQKNATLQQEIERKLIAVQLGTALSTPKSDRKQYGATAGLHLLEELRQGKGGGEQRRTRRAQSSLSTKNEFKERQLRQLGAVLIEGTQHCHRCKGQQSKGGAADGLCE
jgi:hypothetical protein